MCLRIVMKNIPHVSFASFVNIVITPSPIDRGTGYCFRSIFLYLYLCFLVFLLVRLRENGWTDLHEIFRKGVEWQWDDLITFLVNSEKPLDAAMRNTGTGFVVLSRHSLLLILIISIRWSWKYSIRRFDSNANGRFAGPYYSVECMCTYNPCDSLQF